MARVTASVEVHRSAWGVRLRHRPESLLGVADGGRRRSDGLRRVPPKVGDRCLTSRHIGLADRPIGPGVAAVKLGSGGRPAWLRACFAGLGSPDRAGSQDRVPALFRFRATCRFPAGNLTPIGCPSGPRVIHSVSMTVVCEGSGLSSDAEIEVTGGLRPLEVVVDFVAISNPAAVGSWSIGRSKWHPPQIRRWSGVSRCCHFATDRSGERPCSWKWSCPLGRSTRWSSLSARATSGMVLIVNVLSAASADSSSRGMFSPSRAYNEPSASSGRRKAAQPSLSEFAVRRRRRRTRCLRGRP